MKFLIILALTSSFTYGDTLQSFFSNDQQVENLRERSLIQKEIVKNELEIIQLKKDEKTFIAKSKLEEARKLLAEAESDLKEQVETEQTDSESESDFDKRIAALKKDLSEQFHANKKRAIEAFNKWWN